MESTLKRIKRLIIQHRYFFTEKAATERIADGLTEEDILESILSASFVRSKNSRSPQRKRKIEKVYIIESFTTTGFWSILKELYEKRQKRKYSIFSCLRKDQRSISGHETQ